MIRLEGAPDAREAGLIHCLLQGNALVAVILLDEDKSGRGEKVRDQSRSGGKAARGDGSGTGREHLLSARQDKHPRRGIASCRNHDR